MSDWTAVLDQSCGEHYYFNPKTGETTWEKPAGFELPSTAPAPAPAPAAVPAVVAATGKWTAVKDPSSGDTYYFNPATGETTWDTPADFAAPASTPTPTAPTPVPAPSATSSPWKAISDAASGGVYYHNSTTGVTSWDKPADFDASAPAQPASSAAAASSPPPPAAAPAPSPPAPSPSPPPPSATTTAATAASPTSIAPPPPFAAAATTASPPPPISSSTAPPPPSTTTTANPVAPSPTATADSSPVEGGAGGGEGEVSGFEGLRAFAESMKAKREKRAADSAATAAVGGAGGPDGDAAAAAAASTSGGGDLVSFLRVPLEEPTPAPMEEYVEEYFNLNRKGIFGKRTTVEKILSWKSDIINMALKKMPSSDLNKQAKQCFRNITGFMGDRSTTKEDGGHAEKLLKQALTAPEELRDEVYCQLIKQTTRNPSRDSLLKGWQLMGICTGAFPPSKTFEPYLLWYCHTHKSSGGEIAPYAEYCAGRVQTVGNLGPRREVPTAMEIDACRHRVPVILRVYLMDGSFESMPVVSWTTAGTMNKMMAHRLGIKNGDAFALYEITPEGEERYLDKDERLLDMVSYWQRLFEEEKKLADGQSYRVAYKTHMYFDPDPSDDAAERLMYVQAVYDVVSSRYPCNDEDCKTLAGLQLQAELGTRRLPDLETKIRRFLPAKLCTDERRSELTADIQKRHKTHSGKTTIEVQRAYLRHVKGWKIYGSQFFHVEPQVSVDLPDEVFLAVNPRGVLIINPETKDVLAEHPYSEIPTWGHSGSSFVLHIGNLLKQTKLYFQTEQGKEINDLVRAYVNHLCA